MIRLFVIPDVIPSTSAMRKFYNVDCKRNYISKKAYISWSIRNDNGFWHDRLKKAVDNIVFTGNKTRDCISIANFILAQVLPCIESQSINSYSAIRYFWNRLACKSERFDLIIDRVLVRKNANFRPTITKSKLYDKEVKTLIINSTFIQYKHVTVFLRYIQLLFLYCSNKDQRHVYGRFLREKYLNGKIRNCSIDYDTTPYQYDPEEEYSFFDIYTLDTIIKSPVYRTSSRISQNERKAIESLNSTQLMEIYAHIIEIIHKG